jgi:CheY-like chemotaxis protein/HPt (histidine-containing phosphotransfer) domain-containing protein
VARILVIEDNQANMKLACLLLRNAGHVASCAADAETGLTLARTSQPDLILMDIQLPGMDGLAATALLKSDPATAAIPVIALTAMAMKADQEKTRVAGCDAYIAKPLRYQELYAVIDSLLGMHDPQSNVEAIRPYSALQPLPDGDQYATISAALSREVAIRNGRLILVAEDNQTNQKVILRQLSLLGYAADVADDGCLALQYWQKGNYALLLTDVYMPGMDGFELTAAIREQERGSRHMPIVALTASAMKGDGERCRAAGMDDQLCKPLQLADLKTVLETWLPNSVGNVVAHSHAVVRSGFNATTACAVDVGVLERLVGNDPATTREFLADFRIGATKIAQELATACAEGDAIGASHQAHKLMSSARTVGALALGELCAEMETAGKAVNIETLMALLPLFEHEFDAVIACLDTINAPLAAPLVNV